MYIQQILRHFCTTRQRNPTWSKLFAQDQNLALFLVGNYVQILHNLQIRCARFHRIFPPKFGARVISKFDALIFELGSHASPHDRFTNWRHRKLFVWFAGWRTQILGHLKFASTSTTTLFSTVKHFSTKFSITRYQVDLGFWIQHYSARLSIIQYKSAYEFCWIQH